MRTRLVNSSSDPVPSPKGEPYSAEATQGGHQSVLLHEALRELEIRPDDIVIDATLGGAGHARAIAEALESSGILVGFDLDQDAIVRAQTALADAKPQVHLIRSNFRNLGSELAAREILSIDKALFDLGWSGYQLSGGRGFSFLSDEPLLMTYVTDITPETLTAREIVNEWEEESLIDIISGWGEERYSRRIASMIVSRRSTKPFLTARDLAEEIKACVPSVYRWGRIHPATKTFQALRIAVNDELGALQEGLASAWRMLAPGGRIAVITFHSIEDRIVKQLFVQWEREEGGKRITKKPIVPSDDELSHNPRARSAKLRVIEKNTISKDQKTI
ncbi:16S rRNA (cytosine(1402)-N(4))-methyltransferase RsmH [Candidatus Kaiserbacteria bacterium]|nr:16S rRNA (cytosine(1402)-N(4))-methyltransferase RsmH [Candidatus Kaiserbacteria bacterium]